VFTSYRHVLSTPGALGFSGAALVARLPIAMVSLGIILLVEQSTGSYGLAGTVSATYVLAEAAMALVHGKLLDAYGQARVLPLASSLFGASLALMVMAIELDWPRALVYAFAAGAGATLPQVGASVRTRWAHVLDQSRDVQTAFALESVLDEVVFMAGPVLVAFLATAWDPVAGLAVAIVTGLVGTLSYASQRATEPPPRRRSSDGARAPMPWATVLTLAVVALALGTLFGVAEVATVAFADEHGSPGAAGPLLALWAAGSLVGGLTTGAVAWRRGPAVRVRVGMVALTAAMLPLFWLDDLWALGLALLVGGLAIAPTLIATLTTVEQAVPSSRLTEGMAVVHTGIVAGVAPGAAVGGFVIDHHGAPAGYLVAVGAGLLGAVAAQLTRRGAAPDQPADVRPVDSPTH